MRHLARLLTVAMFFIASGAFVASPAEANCDCSENGFNCVSGPTCTCVLNCTCDCTSPVACQATQESNPDTCNCIGQCGFGGAGGGNTTTTTLPGGGGHNTSSCDCTDDGAHCQPAEDCDCSFCPTVNGCACDTCIPSLGCNCDLKCGGTGGATFCFGDGCGQTCDWCQQMGLIDQQSQSAMRGNCGSTIRKLPSGDRVVGDASTWCDQQINYCQALCLGVNDSGTDACPSDPCSRSSFAECMGVLQSTPPFGDSSDTHQMKKICRQRTLLCQHIVGCPSSTSFGLTARAQSSTGLHVVRARH